MKLGYLRSKSEFTSVLLLGISAFLGVLILFKVTGFFTASARSETLVKRAVAQNNTDTKDMDKYFAKYKALADELKKNNLFAPPPPKQHPVKEVLGILGDEVLIKGKWYKVGDKVGDSKIIAIEAAQIRIEWEGKEIILAPMQAADSAGSGARRRAKADMKEGKKDKAQIIRARPQRRPMPGRRGRRTNN